MPLLALSHSLTDARTRWLRGDAQAWNRYVECCLQIEAELRKAQQAHATDGTTQPKPEAPPPAPRS